MKYDDASWHYGGDFPSDLPPEAGATHIAMFLAWALLNGLAGELHQEELPEELDLLRSRQIAPGTYFLQYCDGKLTDEDLNKAGNAFAEAYYNVENSPYPIDYSSAVNGDELPSLYHVPDNWETYEAISPVLNTRFAAWQANGG
jgi:hypothetical protein